MSDTHLHKLRRKCHRINKEQTRLWRKNLRKFEKQGYTWRAAMFMANQIQGINDVYHNLPGKDRNRISNLSRNPSWWNKLTYHKPLRRKVRDTLKVQTLESDEDLQLDFKNKPMKYYW